MAVSATLLRIINEPAPSTRVRMRWADGEELEFASIDDARQWALQAEQVETAKRVLIGRFYASNHDGANPSTVEGRTITVDLLAQNTITVRAANQTELSGARE